MTRDKNVIKPAPGTRKCNCKNKMVTRQIGPGMFQQYTQQVTGFLPPALDAAAQLELYADRRVPNGQSRGSVPPRCRRVQCMVFSGP